MGLRLLDRAALGLLAEQLVQVGLRINNLEELVHLHHGHQTLEILVQTVQDWLRANGCRCIAGTDEHGQPHGTHEGDRAQVKNEVLDCLELQVRANVLLDDRGFALTDVRSGKLDRNQWAVPCNFSERSLLAGGWEFHVSGGLYHAATVQMRLHRAAELATPQHRRH